MWKKITLCTSVCPQYKDKKNVMYINELVNAMYTKMNTLSSHQFCTEFRGCIQYENNMNMLMTGVSCSGVIYITIYGHTFLSFSHGNTAACIELRVASFMKITQTCC